MASELRVDTLKDSSGNNSVGMSYVAEGTTKAWDKTNTAGSSIDDSFNISSLTDTATGTQGHNFTSSFATAGNVSAHATSNEQSSTILFTRDVSYARTTSKITVAAYAWSTPAYQDTAQGVGFLGDLA